LEQLEAIKKRSWRLSSKGIIASTNGILSDDLVNGIALEG
jgi:hypothetical protein